MTGPIIVAGAGIGGLAAALALAQTAFAVELLERAGQIGEVGAGLQIGPNGFRALDRLGLADAIDLICFQPDAIVMRDSTTGEELARQNLGPRFASRFGYPYRVAYRADLQRALLNAVQTMPERITLRLGDGLAAFAQDEAGVVASLASGNRIAGAGLIGADGLWSQTREASAAASLRGQQGVSPIALCCRLSMSLPTC